MNKADFPMDPNLLLRESRWLASLARRLLDDADVADDVVQETWAHYVQKPPRQAGARRSWKLSHIHRGDHFVR